MTINQNLPVPGDAPLESSSHTSRALSPGAGLILPPAVANFNRAFPALTCPARYLSPALLAEMASVAGLRGRPDIALDLRLLLAFETYPA